MTPWRCGCQATFFLQSLFGGGGGAIVLQLGMGSSEQLRLLPSCCVT